MHLLNFPENQNPIQLRNEQYSVSGNRSVYVDSITSEICKELFMYNPT